MNSLHAYCRNTLCRSVSGPVSDACVLADIKNPAMSLLNLPKSLHHKDQELMRPRLISNTYFDSHPKRTVADSLLSSIA